LKAARVWASEQMFYTQHDQTENQQEQDEAQDLLLLGRQGDAHPRLLVFQTSPQDKAAYYIGIALKRR
jgi:hypothetical protein